MAVQVRVARGTVGDMTNDFEIDHEGGYRDPLARLQAYRLGLEAMRDARRDAEELGRDPLTREVSGRLLRAARSIAANIAEGYSRRTTADRRKFLEHAVGSTRECMGWYGTTAHPALRARTARRVSIRRLLLTMIRAARESTIADRKKFAR
jgi:four helix bundle protein